MQRQGYCLKNPGVTFLQKPHIFLRKTERLQTLNSTNSTAYKIGLSVHREFDIFKISDFEFASCTLSI